MYGVCRPVVQEQSMQQDVVWSRWDLLRRHNQKRASGVRCDTPVRGSEWSTPMEEVAMHRTALLRLLRARMAMGESDLLLNCKLGGPEVSSPEHGIGLAKAVRHCTCTQSHVAPSAGGLRSPLVSLLKCDNDNG